MTGALRHGAKHRAKVAVLRDRFPRMVTHRFLVSLLAAARLGQLNTLIQVPNGSTVEHWQRPLRRGLEVVVTHPAHLRVLVNGDFVEEIR